MTAPDDASHPAPHAIDAATALRLLRTGEIAQMGVIPWSYNDVLLVEVRRAADTLLAIYKPRRGERPLWDFPSGTLYLREYAAFLLSEALGWRLTPPTVLRKGPLGPGVLQAFIDSDPEQHYFNIFPDHADDFRRIALFDIIANNADRKAGHCLLDANDHMWSIDHGLCFHVEPKLRTVIWDFAGDPIPTDLCADLHTFAAKLEPAQPLSDALGPLLSPAELTALRHRLTQLLAAARFPYPDPQRRNHPWPPI